jgi:quinol monooxygenase YgiN
MPDHGATITLGLTHAPGKGDEVNAFLKAILPDTRAYKGCRFVHVYRHHTDPNRVILIEEWDSLAEYEAYFAWRTENNSLAPLVALLTAPPQLDFWPTLIT